MSEEKENGNLTAFEAGRLVESVSAIREDISEIKADIHHLAEAMDTRVKPLETFHNRIIGVVILVPTVISILGIIIALGVGNGT